MTVFSLLSKSSLLLTATTGPVVAVILQTQPSTSTSSPSEDWNPFEGLRNGMQQMSEGFTSFTNGGFWVSCRAPAVHIPSCPGPEGGYHDGDEIQIGKWGEVSHWRKERGHGTDRFLFSDKAIDKSISDHAEQYDVTVFSPKIGDEDELPSIPSSIRPSLSSAKKETDYKFAQGLNLPKILDGDELPRIHSSISPSLKMTTAPTLLRSPTTKQNNFDVTIGAKVNNNEGLASRCGVRLSRQVNPTHDQTGVRRTDWSTRSTKDVGDAALELLPCATTTHFPKHFKDLTPRERKERKDELYKILMERGQELQDKEARETEDYRKEVLVKKEEQQRVARRNDTGDRSESRCKEVSPVAKKIEYGSYGQVGNYGSFGRPIPTPSGCPEQTQSLADSPEDSDELRPLIGMRLQSLGEEPLIHRESEANENEFDANEIPLQYGNNSKPNHDMPRVAEKENKSRVGFFTRFTRWVRSFFA